MKKTHSVQCPACGRMMPPGDDGKLEEHTRVSSPKNFQKRAPNEPLLVRCSGSDFPYADVLSGKISNKEPKLG